MHDRLGRRLELMGTLSVLVAPLPPFLDFQSLVSLLPLVFRPPRFWRHRPSCPCRRLFLLPPRPERRCHRPVLWRPAHLLQRLAPDVQCAGGACRFGRFAARCRGPVSVFHLRQLPGGRVLLAACLRKQLRNFRLRFAGGRPDGAFRVLTFTESALPGRRAACPGDELRSLWAAISSG